MKIHKLWIWGIWLLYLLLNIYAIYRLMQLKEYTDIVSLSYAAGGITESKFDQWKESEESRACSKAAVWKKAGEHQVTSEDTGHEQKLICYQVKGQPGAIFGNELQKGRYFTEGEEDVCLLDRGTVRQLFGSEDVSGLHVRMDGNLLRIVGILKEDTPICVLPAKNETVFDGIAVQKKEKTQSSDQTAGMLEASLGAAKGQRIDGHLYYVTAWVLYAGTTAIVTVLSGSAAGKYMGKKYILLLSWITAAGIFLLGVKTAAPGGDYLPTYWSDFEFFEQIFQEKAKQIQELTVHQEFSVWQRMHRDWRQALRAGLIAGAAGVCISAGYCIFNHKIADKE